MEVYFDTAATSRRKPECVYEAMDRFMREGWNLSATKLCKIGEDDNWRFDQITWSAERPEAFAGLHNKRKRIIVAYDEASAIDDKIWEVTEGALTDEETEILWLVFGNPTRTDGRFRECFGKQAHVWQLGQIDSRKVEGTNKKLLQQMVDLYGEDSDYVRVRVKGEFPRASAMGFIDEETVYDAATREMPEIPKTAPLICGLDIARGGNDDCVFRFRRGQDARSIPPILIPGSEVRDSTKLISKVMETVRDSAANAALR